jgi:predicted DNA-binding ribbon-helix-helix protein
MSPHLEVRSVTVARGKTTIALEPYFWMMLVEISKQTSIPFNLLIHDIDSERGQGSRASAMRVYVLKYFAQIAMMNGFKSSSDRQGQSDDAVLANGWFRGRVSKVPFGAS